MALNADAETLSIDNARLPFAEQIDFFRKKRGNYIPTEHFDDVEAEVHERAFVVANGKAADLLADFHGSVLAAMEDGQGIDWFRQEFDKIAAKHGWAYNGSASFRTRTIYETNMLTSYARGRDAQLADPDLRAARPYLKYNIGPAENHRPLHVSWNGLTLRHDDPWIETHRPVKAYGCHCYLSAVAEPTPGRDKAPKESTYTYTDREGRDHIIPAGVDYGFQKSGDGPWKPDYRAYPEGIGKALEQAITQQEAGPHGTPVSDALALSMRGAFAGQLRAALDTVDSVHGDGALPKIPIKKTSSRTDVGMFRALLNGKPISISVSENSPHPELTLAHEIGHFLHWQAMGKAGAWDMDDPFWLPWITAVEESEAITRLAEFPSEPFRDYLLDPKEVWARSYSQYIALRGQNKAMQEGILFTRGFGNLYQYSQWADNDFSPIAEAIDAMFKQLGWIA
ncbi:Phage Mu protein F like protein [Methylomagnum ishizawai]|uniref:Phage Mu protein F like protein n=1 Tax=Methylomagnum ishizawai TaxID=1760988 RepID=A0A1Y6D170_9GAMM|nr:phage minor head protein [Methylomagnum ishizawai]SMF94312.1 Phage Mu protein F like protein [Methylomagnum ishizawai]